MSRRGIHHLFFSFFFYRKLLHQTSQDFSEVVINFDIWGWGGGRGGIGTGKCVRVMGEGRGMFFLKDFEQCGSGSDSGSENLDGCWCVSVCVCVCVCAEDTRESVCVCVCVCVCAVWSVLTGKYEVHVVVQVVRGRHKREEENDEEIKQDICLMSTLFPFENMNVWHQLKTKSLRSLSAVKCCGETDSAPSTKTTYKQEWESNPRLEIHAVGGAAGNITEWGGKEGVLISKREI